MNKTPMNRRNNGLFGNFPNAMDDFFGTDLFGRSLLGNAFKIDVQENEKEYIVEADMPGIKKEEINITLQDGQLTISTKKEENIEDSQKNYLHKERRCSSMSRSIYLVNSNPESVKAKLENGVLTIRVEKEEETKHKIDIE